MVIGWVCFVAGSAGADCWRIGAGAGGSERVARENSFRDSAKDMLGSRSFHN